MTVLDDDAWFEPKRYGYGTGLPIAWQGWALMIGYIIALAGFGVLIAPRHPAVFAVIAVVLTIAFLVVTAHHTRGGMRWRWGGEE